MAYPLPENWACINGDDDFDEINGDLLMSLLEETQGDERDDERLRSVIRSLQAEINPNVMDGPDLLVEPELVSNQEDYQLSGVGQADGHDCSASLDFDFSFTDMEVMPSLANDDIANWYMDPCGDEMDGIIEFGGVRDYSHLYYGLPLMEEHGYSSLWQETYDSVMYG